MAKIEASVIRDLLGRIDELKTALRALGKEGEKRLEPIKVEEVLKTLLPPDGELDAGKWEKLADDEQERVLEKIKELRDSLYTALVSTAPIDPEVVKELLAQVNAIDRAVRTGGDEGRTKLESIKVEEVRQKFPVTKEGKLDTDEWLKRKVGEQRKLYHQLVQIRDSLHVVASLDGPPDPEHIMYSEYASNNAVVSLTGIGFLLVGVLLVAIVMLWDQATGVDYTPKLQAAAVALDTLKAAEEKATKIDAALEAAERRRDAVTDSLVLEGVEERIRYLTGQADSQSVLTGKLTTQAEAAVATAVKALQKGGATEGTVLLMVILLGALGGSLHFVGSLVMFIGNRQLMRSWVPFYLAMPVSGAVLAPIVYMLLRVGLLNPSGGPSDGSGVANLNLIAIYSFSLLTGLFSKTALDKLSEVFKTMFQTRDARSKDELGSAKPPGVAVSKKGKSS